jgi:2-polyprenyl-6-methoxyphenol hydroxylase-like FAD-dependent oxidoreductase
VDKVDGVIIGAGVVGLAVAQRLCGTVEEIEVLDLHQWARGARSGRGGRGGGGVLACGDGHHL